MAETDFPGAARSLLRLVSGFSVPKHSGSPNEDRWAHSDDGTVCAVSDGASVSFDPGPWAELLVRRFIADAQVDRAWLSAAAAEFEGRHDRESLSWSRQAAFDRGSFATLLGVRPSADGTKAYVLGVGDSLAVLLDGTAVAATFPYQQPEEFDRSPLLLASAPIQNRAFTDEALELSVQPYMVAEVGCPRLLLMTDALGRWFVERRDRDAAAVLLGLSTADDFAGFVERERAAGHMRRDDTTLVTMGLGDELPADH